MKKLCGLSQLKPGHFRHHFWWQGYDTWDLCRKCGGPL